MASFLETTVRTATGREYDISICQTHQLQCCYRCGFDFSEMNNTERTNAEALDAQQNSLQCAKIGCLNTGGQVCSGCKLVRYCSVKCQKSSWKKHKKVCKAFARNVVSKVNIGTDSDEIVDILPIGTRVALYSGFGEKEGVVKAFHVGKGPFKDPLVLIDDELHRDWLDQVMNDPCSCLPHYAIKCKDSTIELEEASALHNNWFILDDDGNPIIDGAEHSVAVDDVPLDLSGLCSKFLLVSGFILSHVNCHYSQGLQKVLREGDHVDGYTSMNIEKIEAIGYILSETYTCCVFFGVGSDGPQSLKQIYHNDLRKAITKWVEAGGIFIAQGEGCICKVFKDWFKLPWTQGNYERSETKLNRKCTSIPRETFGKLPSSNNIKAVYLDGVDDKHNLYKNQRSSAVAFAPFGKGRVGFIGDVNSEKNSLEIIHQLGLLGEVFVGQVSSSS